ncbi:MAG: hypothetical protein ACTHU0_32170 [Kofleriaceae bacterium]
MQHRLVVVAAALIASGCAGLLAKKHGSGRRFESQSYPAMRGKVGFSLERIPGSAAEDPKPVAFIETTDLSADLHVRGYLPEPYGARAGKPCKPTWIPGWGNYDHAQFISVKIGGSGDEIVLGLEPLAYVYANQIVEIDPEYATLYSPGQHAFPFARRSSSYHFAVDVLPRLQPGANALVFTAGVRCMSDPSIAVQVSSTLTVQLDEAKLAALRTEIGPEVEVALQTNLQGEIPRVTDQLVQLFPEYEPVFVAPLDRGWTVRKNELGHPLHRFFYAVVVAREKATGRCFGNQGIVGSEFGGNGYLDPELRLETEVWVPFPCDHVSRRVQYTHPDARKEPE